MPNLKTFILAMKWNAAEKYDFCEIYTHSHVQHKMKENRMVIKSSYSEK